MNDAGQTVDGGGRVTRPVSEVARWAVLAGGVLVVLRGLFTLLDIVVYTTNGTSLPLGPLWAIALPYPGVGGEGLYGLLAVVSLVVGGAIVTTVLLPRGRGPVGVGVAGAAIVVAHVLGAIVISLTLLADGQGPVWSFRVALLGLTVPEVLFSLLVLALGAVGAVAGLAAAGRTAGSGPAADAAAMSPPAPPAAPAAPPHTPAPPASAEEGEM